MSEGEDHTGGCSRRQLLVGTTTIAAAWTTGLVAGSLSAGCDQHSADDESESTDEPQNPAENPDENPDLSRWSAVREQFDADEELIHMAGMLLATHPRPVRLAIERHRRGLDDNPTDYLLDRLASTREQLDDDGEQGAKQAAGDYLDIQPAHIALTDSTTEGLATVYHGIHIRPDQQVIAAGWNHWATEGSLNHAASKLGFEIHHADIYDDPATAGGNEMVERLVEAIEPNTRVVALTWVHSITGLKLPVGRIGERIAEINADRSPQDRIIYCIDGVHGFGVEDVVFDQLNCDFFIAGCHKWLFGPRGTGIIAARPEAWQQATPTVPTFSFGITPGRRFTPGGFKPYEHVWALREAFEFHRDIGKDRVEQRIHELADHLVEELDGMDHIRLRTPTDPDLRAGVVTFRVDGHTPRSVVDRLREDDIIASITPEDRASPRLAPGLLNDHDEIEQVLDALRQLA